MYNRLFLLFGLVLLVSYQSVAQMRNNYFLTTEGYIDLNVSYGQMTNNYTRVTMSNYYSNPVNVKNGNFSYTNPSSYGFDLKAGYYLNDKKTVGFTIGLDYFNQSVVLGLDSFHIEYKSVDKKKRTFRQVLTLSNLADVMTGNSISIPFMLHLQKNNSKYSFLSLDAGILYNLYESYTYSSSGRGDYEAIYKFNVSGDQGTAVYDASTTPGVNDVFITKKDYLAHNPLGDVNAYFTTKYNNGMNVGLNQRITGSGTVDYQRGNIGVIVQPSFSYQVTDLIYLNIGFYYLYQKFDISGSTYRNKISDAIGTYNGVANEATSYTSSSYGVSIGLKYFLKDKTDESIIFVAPIW
jgi:hypothetical protein